MAPAPKEIIKYVPSIYFSLFPNKTIRLGLYKDSENNYTWLTKDQVYWQPVDMGKKPQYERVTCDTSQEAFELARQGAEHRNNGTSSTAYSPYVHQEVSYVDGINQGVANSPYPTVQEGMNTGELNCIIASKNTGRIMNNAYIQAKNADAVLDAIKNLNLDDVRRLKRGFVVYTTN